MNYSAFTKAMVNAKPRRKPDPAHAGQSH
jgi:hypothetical protein